MLIRAAFIGLKARKYARIAQPTCGRAGCKWRPVAAYLLKKQYKRTAALTFIATFPEGLAVKLWDEGPFKPFDLRVRDPPPPRPRGGKLPTTAEAINAYTQALDKVRGRDHTRESVLDSLGAVRHSIGNIGHALRQGGMTPFTPIVGGAVRKQVMRNQGVPEWVIVVSNLAIPLRL